MLSGSAIKVLFARPPGLAYLYGSFEKGQIERKEKQRREKIKVQYRQNLRFAVNKG